MKDTPITLETAQQMVKAYGHVLSQLNPNSYGHPVSLLPHVKSDLEDAILLLLETLDGADTHICESLAHSYVFLAQFIDDDLAELIAQSQEFLVQSDFDDEHLDLADEARKVINKVKLDMETKIEEVSRYMPNHSPA